MPNMEAATVAKIVAKEVVARFGVPSAIHSDQGKQFEGKVFTEMCRVLNIKKTRTTPYHPQSDGMVERFNKTLLSMLRTLVDENQTNCRTGNYRMQPKLSYVWKRGKTHGNLILQKPFLHFRARLNCDVEQNCLCHVVDHS